MLAFMKNKLLFLVKCTENKPNADYAKQMAENKHCTEQLSELYYQFHYKQSILA
jgi:hypothetical protein